MKALLEFNLDDHFERDQHKLAINASNLHIAITELDNRLRAIIKYDSSKPEEFVAGVQEARDILHALLNDYNIDIP